MDHQVTLFCTGPIPENLKLFAKNVLQSKVFTHESIFIEEDGFFFFMQCPLTEAMCVFKQKGNMIEGVKISSVITFPINL